MRLLLFAVVLALLGIFASYAIQDPDCVRPPPDDLYDYKEAYVPVEFDHEPFAMEVVDLAVLAAAMLIGAWFSLSRKPSRWISVLMLAALLYFGFFRGGCICPVGATTNFCIGLAAPELIGRVVAVLFLLPLLFTFFFGRIFCSSACPIGALQHLLSRKKTAPLSHRVNAVLRLLPVALLAVTVWGALRGGMFIACKLDVYKVAFFTGYAWIDQIVLLFQRAATEHRILLVGDGLAWILFAATVAVGFYVSRPFCRFLCPYGVLLGAVSALGLRRRNVDSGACVNCKACEKACPVQAISSSADGKQVEISSFHCIQCGRCDEACHLGGIFNR